MKPHKWVSEVFPERLGFHFNLAASLELHTELKTCSWAVNVKFQIFFFWI